MSNMIKQCFKQQWNIHHNFKFAHFFMMDNKKEFRNCDIEKVERIATEMRKKGTLKDNNPHILDTIWIVDIFIK